MNYTKQSFLDLLEDDDIMSRSRVSAYYNEIFVVATALYQVGYRINDIFCPIEGTNVSVMMWFTSLKIKESICIKL